MPGKYRFHKERKPFSREEDLLLKELVSKFGEDNWTAVAHSMTNRSVRQCRERWQNSLSENVIKSKWSEEEDQVLLSQYEKTGPKWKNMEVFFPGRTSYSIRNRFNSLYKKMVKSEIDDQSDEYSDIRSKLKKKRNGNKGKQNEKSEINPKNEVIYGKQHNEKSVQGISHTVDNIFENEEYLYFSSLIENNFDEFSSFSGDFVDDFNFCN
ncbi:Myb-like DNA-binding domain containing protein [Tritrichomonas foetus]|uniref:Myb-like DNA-binding domain containing protein n=1 Tax=Tritrichomonas foetus TaxID=1144522 RepID=A0A1J4K9D3_9EUKA|nr:Myb-like DNA-binding domain containing protein [Tritrichomonas foetus]|eukprot:OHT06300.1 Myb-like DNA-binding domain containing protein [Tritrichomonas foetus]